MSMFDDVLGFGRTDFVNESVEPELENDTLEEAEALEESCDPMEFMVECAYINELNMRSIDEAIMCEEYAHLKENGTEMIYEAGTFSNIVANAKKAVMNVWNNIKKFIADQIKRMQERSTTSFLEKYSKRALKAKTGTINGYKDLMMGGQASHFKKTVTAAFSTCEDQAKSLTNQALSASKDKDFTVKKSDKAESLFSKTRDKKTGTIFLADYLGKKDTFKMDVKEAIKTLKNASQYKTDLKTAYDSSKKVVDAQLKALKNVESQSKKFKVISTEMSKKYHGIIKEVNAISTVLAKVNREYAKLINISVAQAKAAIVAAASTIPANEGADDFAGNMNSFIENTVIM